MIIFVGQGWLFVTNWNYGFI